MSTLPPRGSRLLPTLVDYYATNDTPRKPWAAIPINNNDISQGFKDITYKQLANAVNHAAGWLLDTLPSATADFETIAYVGPKDARYAILALAVAKVGRKVLLPSPFTAPAALAHLVQKSKVKTFIHGEGLAPLAQGILSQIADREARAVQVPELSDWLNEQVAKHIPFTKTWEQAKDEPWMIFHTSGTTGLPKLLTYTHEMMTSLEATDLVPGARANRSDDEFENNRVYTPLPSLHVIGMYFVLQLPVFFNSTIVLEPISRGPPNPAAILSTLHHGRVNLALLPPALIDAFCSFPAGLSALRSLKLLYFGGAPLSGKSATLLSSHTKLMPTFGSTEQGLYLLQHHADGEDWEYLAFHDCMGLEFRHVSDKLYELVFVRKEGLERYQQVFKVYPELQEFPTKDLFTPHPSKPGRWKAIGRTDDMIVFSHAHDLHATSVEDAIAQHAGVAAVLIGGHGRSKPFMLVEWQAGVAEADQTVEAISPTIEKVNEGIVELVRLEKAMVLIVTPERKLVRTQKGTVARRESEALYKDDIDALYREAA